MPGERTTTGTGGRADPELSVPAARVDGASGRRLAGASGLRLVLGVVLGGCLFAWFTWTIHWPEFTAALLGVKPVYVLLAAVIVYGEFVLRTLRWKIILRSVAPGARLGQLFIANVIGAATNTLLPARAGDVVRPVMASRSTGARLVPLFASTVVERVFDLIGLLFVFLLLLIFLPRVEGPDGVLVENLRRYGFIMGGAGLGGLIVLLWVAGRKTALHRRAVKLLGIVPGRWGDRLVRLFDGIMEGLGAMRRVRDVAGVLFCTLLLWFNGVVAIRLLFYAFDLDLPLGAACFTAVAIALTVALPQAPGFVGVFHVAIEKTLVLWGMDPTPSKAFAIVFWGISFVPVTATGLLALWREGLGLGDVFRRAGAAHLESPNVAVFPLASRSPDVSE
jgi:glycosyltransferase 2 family protein